VSDLEFTEETLERYSRHILLKEVGVEGQRRLWKSRVLVVGAGGLGAPVSLYLAAAGVGTLGIADGDQVDLSNLQRQVVHHTPDVGRPKVESAAEKLRAINPDITVKTIPHRLTAGEIMAVIDGYDFVIDGTDNFAAKFLINDACVLAGKPFSHGGILRFKGQTMTVTPGRSACYRCVFPEPPPPDAVPTCSQAGVLGAVAGMLGTIQAAETLKVLLGIGKPLLDTLLTFDALDMNFRRVFLRREPGCPVCGDHPVILEPRDEEPAACGVRLGASQECTQRMGGEVGQCRR
jgi:molybdopterin-synthase adenylyltransferase